MPYYGFRSLKSFLKYNGYNRKNEFIEGSSEGDPLLDSQDYMWEEGVQCMTNDCEIVSKQTCDDNPGMQPCVCYDSCPLGASFHPMFDEWINEFGAASEERLAYLGRQTI